MIPVPDSEIIIYDLRQETDIKYKTLIEKEIRFINRNTKIILDHASVIYKQKISGLDINYLNNTLDFRNLEKAHDNF